MQRKSSFDEVVLSKSLTAGLGDSWAIQTCMDWLSLSDELEIFENFANSETLSESIG